MICARCSSAGQHLASVLQEGRENENIDASLGGSCAKGHPAFMGSSLLVDRTIIGGAQFVLTIANIHMGTVKSANSRGETPMTATPWAVLLVTLKDNETKTRGMDFYQNLFTSAGDGSENMVEYFRDVSHGHVDLSGSQVLGWYNLNLSSQEYWANQDQGDRRNKFIKLAKDTASADKLNPVTLANFFNVVICINVPLESYGGIPGAVFDDAGLYPSLAGQEMGHGYGLQHSRIEGSLVDYRDSWDIMSTLNAWMDNSAPLGRSGPFLNAANMDSIGWLDSSRVWSPGHPVKGMIVELRPLSRPDLPGYIAALVNSFYVEFRVKEKWDKAIPKPAILVHHFDGERSYLMRGTGGGLSNIGNADLGWGGVFEHDDGHTHTRIEVVDIDPAAHIATLKIDSSLRVYPTLQEVGLLIGGAQYDAPGWWWRLGATRVPIPPQPPWLFELDRELTALKLASEVKDGPLRFKSQTRALQAMAGVATRELNRMMSFHQPAPHADREGK
jgi:hypothetical protein